MSDNWIPGDHYVIDDRTGLKVRASETARQWDQLLVHQKNFEQRHPQDFVRAVRDNQTVDNPRPRAIDTFIGPLDTEISVAALAGSGGINVLSTVRMRVGDRLSIMLDNVDTFRCAILGVSSAVFLLINPELPWSAAVGQKVYDNTAMAEPALP